MGMLEDKRLWSQMRFSMREKGLNRMDDLICSVEMEGNMFRVFGFIIRM